MEKYFSFALTIADICKGKTPLSIGSINRMGLSIINGLKTETMYVYYITMKIYVLNYMNIFSHFYCLYTISMPHHFPTMNFPWTTPKNFKTKFALLS
jgi:hypothetical protein